MTSARPSTGAALLVVVPVLDEGPTVGELLTGLRPLRERGSRVVVVDGGSTDDTIAIAEPLADRVLSARRGRAAQQNAGAASEGSEVLLFLHSDTRLPAQADLLIGRALDAGRAWGRFDVRIDSRRPLLRVVSWSMNERSHLSGIVTGDQAIFVRRDLFERVGAFPAVPLMEDVALSKLLRRKGRPARIRVPVVTSARRWEQNGAWRTIVLMWRTRLEYFFGADPERLAVRYGYRASD